MQFGMNLSLNLTLSRPISMAHKVRKRTPGGLRLHRCRRRRERPARHAGSSRGRPAPDVRRHLRRERE
ncbi:MAG: hypothetical protein WDM84_00200 [Bauldia sp.]